MTEMDERAPEPGGKSWPRIALAAGTIILLLGVATLLLDPFGWHLVDRLRGEYDAAAAAVPADSVAYLGANLLSTSRFRLDDIQDSFADATAGTDVDVDTINQQLEELLAQELGIVFAEDVTPWVGQYVGFAVIDAGVDAFGQSTTFEWLLSVETRDRQASDRFLEKLASGWEASSGESGVAEAYDGATMTHFTGFAFGRSGGLVLFASSLEALRKSIDSQHGASLPDTADYEAAVSQLSNDRLLTMFVNGEQFNELIASVPTPLVQISAENLPSASIQGIAIALALIEEGIRIDTATVYDEDKMSALQQESLQTRILEPTTAELFPADTRLFISGKGVDLLWASIRRALIAELGRADFDESMRLFVDEFGIDLDEGLFPYLDGDAALGLLPSDQGTIAAVTGVDLGIALVVGTSEQATLAANIDAFAERIGRPQGGLGVVSASNDAGLTIYEFDTILVPELLAAFGSGRGHLLLGTSEETIRSLRFDGGRSLADRDDYREVWRAFPLATSSSPMSPGLFVDVQGTYQSIETSGVLSESQVDVLGAIAQSIPYVAGASTVEGNVAWSTIIIFVEQGE